MESSDATLLNEPATENIGGLQSFSILDQYSGMNSPGSADTTAALRRSSSRLELRAQPRAAQQVSRRMLVLLALTGAVTMTLSYWIDQAISHLLSARSPGNPCWCSSLVGSNCSWSLRFVLYVLSGCCMVALAVKIVELEPTAAGSGIPPMISVFDGIFLQNLLTWRTGLVKAAGLILCIGGGLSIGKEGPFVHLACISCTALMQLPCFKESLYEDGILRVQVLSAAAAAGVACTFGAPLAGTLFSIEVHHSNYNTSTLLYAFYASMITGAIVWAAHKPNSLALFRVSLQSFDVTCLDLLTFVVAGALCGVLGALFVRVTFAVGELRVRYLRSSVARLSFAVLVVGGTLCAWFPLGPTFHGTQRSVLEALFTSTETPTSQLVAFPIIKFVATSLALNTALPSGCFAPSFAIGASIGHALGRLIASSLGASATDLALVCAAAYSGAVTRTLSPALLVLELSNRSGDVSVATGLAVITAYAVASRLAPSIYRSHEMLHIPHMAEPPASAQTARHLMRSKVDCVQPYDSVTEVARVLEHSQQMWFPCVDSSEGGVLLGDLHFKDLSAFLSEQEEGGTELKGLGAWLAADQNPHSMWHTHLQLDPDAPLRLVHRVFTMLGPSSIYVTEGGVLLGIIFKQDIVTRGYMSHAELQ